MSDLTGVQRWRPIFKRRDGSISDGDMRTHDYGSYILFIDAEEIVEKIVNRVCRHWFCFDRDEWRSHCENEVTGEDAPFCQHCGGRVEVV